MNDKLIEKPSQAGRIIKVLLDNEGEWVSARKFIQEMMISQSHARIFSLENDDQWKNKYLGYQIEHSPFVDLHGFKSYRIIKKETLF